MPMAATERVPRSYMFDLGDSNDGPIGAVIRVEALTAELALARLQSLLPEFVELGQTITGLDQPTEYATVYFNARHATVEPGWTECVDCQAMLHEDQDRCPYEHEHGYTPKEDQ